MTDQEKAKIQELQSNYNLLCIKYKQLKKESEKKDKIIIEQDKTINEFKEKLSNIKKKEGNEK